MSKLLVLVLLAAYVAAGTIKPPSPIFCDNDDFTDFKDEMNCYLLKTINYLRRAAQYRDIDIADGITLVRDAPMERSSKSLQQSEWEIIKELPSDSTERMTKVWTMLFDAANSFFNSHSLSLKLSKQSVARALDEGRAKLKKLVWPAITIVGLKLAALIPFLLTGLGYLALKAYLFGKIALVIAGIAAFDKFFGSDKNSTGNVFNKYPTFAWHDSGSVAGNWNVDPAAHQHQSPPTGYRSLDDADAKVDAHNLAYSAHAPVPNATE